MKHLNILKCDSRCDEVTPRYRYEYSATPADVGSECPEPEVRCNPDTPFRSMDGSCNNLEHTRWGEAERVQNRVVDNAFEDGRKEPRATSSCSGAKLPSPRAVSSRVHTADATTMETERRVTYMITVLGQFLAHDFTLTRFFERSDGNSLECCLEDSSNPECIQIPVSDDDPFFNVSCLGLPRSVALTDCCGVRQPVNSQTAYLDLSVTYGSSEKENKILRELRGGLMKMNGQRLPADIDDTACELNKTFDPYTFYCLKAGDLRVNEVPSLSSMQTLFAHAHNDIASGLQLVNPHWHDERLFQEARRILVAIWQNIVYGEYLPILLGERTVKKLNIHIRPHGYKDTYDCNTDATVINSVAAAAHRDGHSNVNRFTGQRDEDFRLMYLDNLENNFFKPNAILSDGGDGYNNILRWATAEKCPMLDRNVEGSVQQRLFPDADGNTLDLAALNIQRGREHGLPGYNAYRKLCGLSEACHFGTGKGGLVDHDENTVKLLEDVYECPDDIDLFTGIITERRGSEGLLGPLGTCMIGEQYKRFRDGDRFFFERNDPVVGFTKPQLNAIKKMTMASLICQHTSTTKLQPNVFVMPNKNMKNERVHCDDLPSLDLSLWKEKERGRHTLQ